MSVRIKFTRVGRPHVPYFRLVAIDKRKSNVAKPLEILGTFNPIKGRKAETVHVDRIKHWISLGALPTDSVRQQLKKSGLWNQVKPGAEASKKAN